jgi:hypothetical protein
MSPLTPPPCPVNAQAQPQPQPLSRARLRRAAACAALGLLSLSPLAQAGDGGEPGDAAALDQKPASTTTVDKSQYNLFNPTPDNLLREFESSRPDQTTGPHTVDAGHYYLEIGLFENSLSFGATRNSSWIPLQNSHFRVGLTNTIELELIYDGVYNQNTQALSAATGKRSDRTVDGSGDVTVRMRFNLIGDDGGPFAFAIIPQFVAPTATSHLASEHFEGNVILPVSFKLPAGFSTILQVEPGTARNAADTKDVFALTSGATLYHDILRKRDHVQLYLEYFDTLATGGDDTLAQQVDAGLRWRPIENWQLDFGANFGVSKPAPDYQSFAGISTRF